MEPEDVDHRIATLRATVEAARNNLFELDAIHVRQMLDVAELTGVSATRWGEARIELANLWHWLQLLSEFVEDLSRQRGNKRGLSLSASADLATRLEGPVIELDVVRVPIAERGIVDLSRKVTRCNADELIAKVSDAFDLVNGAVAAATRAWEQYSPRLAAAKSKLSDASELDARISQLARDIMHDPMSVDEGAVAEVERAVEAATTFKVEFDNARESAEARLKQVGAAIEAARVAHEEVSLKIAAPQIPDPPQPCDALCADLADIVALAGKGQWLEVQTRLTTWASKVEEVERQAVESREAIRAPLQQRKELRGLLDAYRAKGEALRLLGNTKAAALYDQARMTLYTAPTDLTHADSLVRMFGRAVSRSDQIEDGES